MGTNYRLAKEGDVIRISTVFAEAHDDLYRKRGFNELPTNPIPPHPIFAFLIRKTSDAFWVAEEEGKIIGFSDSREEGHIFNFRQLS